MTTLTHEEINQIINNAKPNVKTVCDCLYNKSAEVAGGGNEHFKAILDDVFDALLDGEIELLYNQFNAYFMHEGGCMTPLQINDYMNICEEINSKYFIVLPARGSNKLLTASIRILVHNSVQQAFVEQLAKYVGK